MYPMYDLFTYFNIFHGYCRIAKITEINWNIVHYYFLSKIWQNS